MSFQLSGNQENKTSKNGKRLGLMGDEVCPSRTTKFAEEAAIEFALMAFWFLLFLRDLYQSE